MTNPQTIKTARFRVLNVYAKALDTKARYILLWGGRSAGRSHFAIQRYIMLMRNGNIYFRGYFMREVMGDIRESLWRDFTDQINDLGIADEFLINNGSMKATHIASGNTIISKGFKKSAGNQTARLKSIAGATHVLIEEADEVGEKDFDKLDDSLRTIKVDQVQLMLLFNPEDENSWINKRWFTNNKPNKDPELLSIHATYKDNLKYTAASTISKMESYKERDPEYYDIFTLGKWGGGAKGRVFENWKIISELPDFVAPVYGLDFGFTNDPCALVKIEFHNDRIYIDEIFYETGLTNQDIAQRMKDEGITGPVYADSAEPKSIEELRREGIDVFKASKGADSIRAGIDFIKARETFVTHRSKNIIHERKYYVWKTDRDGNPTNTPIDQHNHGMDGIRYGLTPYRKPQWTGSF